MAYKDKEAERAYQKQWRAANRDKKNAYDREWRRKNPDKAAATSKKYYESNKERASDRGKAWYDANKDRKSDSSRRWALENSARKQRKGKEWRDANPDAARAIYANQRAVRLGVVRVRYVDSEVFDRDDYYCQACGIKTNRNGDSGTYPAYPNKDHIVPISKGGHDALYNLQTLCRSCNRAKGDGDNDEFLTSLE